MQKVPFITGLQLIKIGSLLMPVKRMVYPEIPNVPLLLEADALVFLLRTVGLYFSIGIFIFFDIIFQRL